jgi:FtsH-binding integral membrane protein
MSLALSITALSALWVVSSDFALNLFLGSSTSVFILIIAQFGLALALSWGLNRMSFPLAIFLFMTYSFLTGITCSSVFLIYTAESIVSTFFVTAGTFAGMSLYGYFTKKDLSSWGQYLFMGLIGIIIASLVNIFMKSEMVMWVTTYIGVILFVGLTAYDTQKIKGMLSNVSSNEINDRSMKLALFGSFVLYLDFINLFLKLIRILGKKK